MSWRHVTAIRGISMRSKASAIEDMIAARKKKRLSVSTPESSLLQATPCNVTIWRQRCTTVAQLGTTTLAWANPVAIRRTTGAATA